MAELTQRDRDNIRAARLRRHPSRPISGKSLVVVLVVVPVVGWVALALLGHHVSTQPPAARASLTTMEISDRVDRVWSDDHWSRCAGGASKVDAVTGGTVSCLVYSDGKLRPDRQIDVSVSSVTDTSATLQIPGPRGRATAEVPVYREE